MIMDVKLETFRFSKFTIVDIDRKDSFDVKSEYSVVLALHHLRNDFRIILNFHIFDEFEEFLNSIIDKNFTVGSKGYVLIDNFNHIKSFIPYAYIKDEMDTLSKEGEER